MALLLKSHICLCIMHAIWQVTILSEQNEKPREMKIEGYHSTACGGTHVDSFGEIQSLTIRNIKKQKGELKISYDVV